MIIRLVVSLMVRTAICHTKGNLYFLIFKRFKDSFQGEKRLVSEFYFHEISVQGIRLKMNN